MYTKVTIIFHYGKVWLEFTNPEVRVTIFPLNNLVLPFLPGKDALTCFQKNLPANSKNSCELIIWLLGIKNLIKKKKPNIQQPYPTSGSSKIILRKKAAT